ncbi:dienelactone hydrolase family protein [Pseudacidovorax intermedius]|uniref:dienelactone hydrolase family protein n=2 Tax=Pseudacidovorax TaxID=433923 RepID=UPI0007350519|nr:dienelactone hydrolase family protein [Pseudacidovorax intermedius]
MTSTTPAPRSADVPGVLWQPTGPANGRAVLVLHEAPGITSNVRRRGAALAALGYTVFAPDLHRAGRALDRDESHAAVAAFQHDPLLLRQRVAESLAHLCRACGAAPAQVAVLGYCFGGMAALEFARSGAEAGLVTSYHGLLATRVPAPRGGVRMPLMVFTGALDPLVPLADVAAFQQEMLDAQARWRLVMYGQARHSFTNADAGGFGDPRMQHDAEADADAWAQTLSGLAVMR